MIEAVRPETLVNIYKTSRRNNPQNCLHTSRRENLKSKFNLRFMGSKDMVVKKASDRPIVVQIIFYVATPCSHGTCFQCFRGFCCLHEEGSRQLPRKLVTTYIITRCHNPKDHNLFNFRRHEDLKPHTDQ
jgi:hypothetical protein